MKAHLRRGHEGERGVRTVRSEAAAEDERVKAESDDDRFRQLCGRLR